MATHQHPSSRRTFLAASLVGGLAGVVRGQTSAAGSTPAGAPSRVAVTAGDDHPDLVFRGLKAFEKEIARAIDDRRVVVKPNNVAIDKPLSATPAECLAGILEFLKSIGKLANAVIAESAGEGPTREGFANYGYPAVAAKYGVRLMDLDQEPHEVVRVFDQRDFRPHAVRMARLLLDPNSFLISAAKMKTHDQVVATLSLKNIIFGAPIKDRGYGARGRGKPGAKSDKPIAHGGGIRGLNFNLFALAQRLRPHLAVIDGYTGMEGFGPTRGTPVEHRVCVVSPDWLAADRTAIELMGIDFANVGYLNYCAEAGMGEADLKKIEIVGEPLAQHVKTYRLAPNIEQQLIWKKLP